MIVVAIIAIIAAIAMMNLLRSRIQANEAAAIENLHTVSEAQLAYNATHSTFGTFEELTAPTDGAAPWIDETWLEGVTKSGYVYFMPLVEENDYEVYAEPIIENRTGTRYFRTDGSGVVRATTGARPDDSSPTI